ncbi:MAG: hypothetical protein AABY93_08975 [Bacteroidota bacterium]
MLSVEKNNEIDERLKAMHEEKVFIRQKRDEVLKVLSGIEMDIAEEVITQTSSVLRKQQLSITVQ